ncbi:hypothetical protein Srufu_026820 [Streptomyces libani subsp. rufus]|nr:hypothetical protein Srufu_026820 [Streptomyces libani subsp. rufus]
MLLSPRHAARSAGTPGTAVHSPREPVVRGRAAVDSGGCGAPAGALLVSAVGGGGRRYRARAGERGLVDVVRGWAGLGWAGLGWGSFAGRLWSVGAGVGRGGGGPPGARRGRRRGKAVPETVPKALPDAVSVAGNG